MIWCGTQWLPGWTENQQQRVNYYGYASADHFPADKKTTKYYHKSHEGQVKDIAHIKNKIIKKKKRISYSIVFILLIWKKKKLLWEWGWDKKTSKVQIMKE